MKALDTVFTVLVCSAIAVGVSGAAPETPAPIVDAPTQLQNSLELYEAEDYGGSLQAADSALQTLRRQTAIAYNNICSAQLKLGRHDAAVEACKSALAINPGYKLARNNMANIYEQLAAIAPTAGVYLFLSEARYWQGEIEASIAAAERALEFDPMNAVAHNNLCAAHARNEQWDLAVRECETAIEILPDFERARNNLDWAMSRKMPSTN